MQWQEVGTGETRKVPVTTCWGYASSAAIRERQTAALGTAPINRRVGDEEFVCAGRTEKVLLASSPDYPPNCWGKVSASWLIKAIKGFDLIV